MKETESKRNLWKQLKDPHHDDHSLAGTGLLCPSRGTGPPDNSTLSQGGSSWAVHLWEVWGVNEGLWKGMQIVGRPLKTPGQLTDQQMCCLESLIVLFSRDFKRHDQLHQFVKPYRTRTISSRSHISEKPSECWQKLLCEQLSSGWGLPSASQTVRRDQQKPDFWLPRVWAGLSGPQDSRLQMDTPEAISLREQVKTMTVIRL